MIGIGFDIHRLGGNGPLRLGGVEIPFDRGLMAHSDGDVLIHALIDALLGAVGGPDIGDLFPDTDPKWKGTDSLEMLKAVLSMIGQISIVNIDAVLIMDSPSLGHYKEQIRQRLSEVLGLPVEKVGIKAKTTEGLLENAISSIVTVQLA